LEQQGCFEHFIISTCLAFVGFHDLPSNKWEDSDRKSHSVCSWTEDILRVHFNGLSVINLNIWELIISVIFFLNGCYKSENNNKLVKLLLQMCQTAIAQRQSCVRLSVLTC